MKAGPAIIAQTALICISLFIGCKKGEGDPFISLRSRKARMANDWKLKSCIWEYNRLTATGKPINEIIEVANGSLADNYTDSSGTTKFSIPFSMQLSTDKKGGFILKETISNQVFKAAGNWDFALGVGSAKSKEDLYMKMTETLENSSDASLLFFGGNNEVNLHIRTLREKRLVLVCEKNTLLNTNGKNYLLRAEYIFEP
jgi:hypothetical protein